MSDPVQFVCVDLMRKQWVLIISVVAGITSLCLRQPVMIDNSNDYALPMGDGGRAGTMRGGRDERA